MGSLRSRLDSLRERLRPWVAAHGDPERWREGMTRFAERHGPLFVALAGLGILLLLLLGLVLVIGLVAWAWAKAGPTGLLILFVGTCPLWASLVGFLYLAWDLRWDRPSDRGWRSLETRAGQGDPEACHSLGVAFRHGNAQVPSDLHLARAWFLKAAEAGHPEAMVELAQLLRWKAGGPKDPDGARAWLERAVEAGHEGAREILVRMLETGDGIPADPGAAEEWRRRG